VFATAAEDMDALTFGSSVVLRHMTASEQKKLPIREINLDHLLAEIGLTQSQFIDLCILLGCDYCDSMKGVGPAKGLGLVRQHGSIENIIANNPKLNVPENWLYQVCCSHKVVLQYTCILRNHYTIVPLVVGSKAVVCQS
jgi:flap endonuclease-1